MEGEADVSFTFAFQPIVDADKETVAAYEALVRGTQEENALDVLQRAAAGSLTEFNRSSHRQAIELAHRLELRSSLHLNVTPGLLSAAAASAGELVAMMKSRHLKAEQLVFEITEHEAIENEADFRRAIWALRESGIRLALDDFGAGWSGLKLLANFQPQLVKLDMGLVRGIEADGPRQTIVRAVLTVCEDLGIEVIAEGVETVSEYEWFREHQVFLFQGFLFARPQLQALPTACLPDVVRPITAPARS